MDGHVYSAKVRNRLKTLTKKKWEAEQRVKDIQYEIDRLICGQAPIKVGDLVVWDGTARVRRGRVVYVSDRYNGFHYRVEIMTRDGRVIGHAEVGERENVRLVTEEES